MAKWSSPHKVDDYTYLACHCSEYTEYYIERRAFTDSNCTVECEDDDDSGSNCRTNVNGYVSGEYIGLSSEDDDGQTCLLPKAWSDGSGFDLYVGGGSCPTSQWYEGYPMSQNSGMCEYDEHMDMYIKSTVFEYDGWKDSFVGGDHSYSYSMSSMQSAYSMDAPTPSPTGTVGLSLIHI